MECDIMTMIRYYILLCENLKTYLYPVRFYQQEKRLSTVLSIYSYEIFIGVHLMLFHLVTVTQHWSLENDTFIE